ncbi:hypothetical protein RQP53_03580 [Paucibacter sp. APW11]|uniref:Uncharacterized protein n=1 Tax=Roseateles aquae TaxID=3077235 RepID=A0ABU3P734_9BURK|nr:hypothetical protein [Paucibacter sp. APW11]MDT8998354.1 hypothetical protein [Paucibacter sp. APW11]
MNDVPTTAELFGTGMAARQLSFICLAADATEPIAAGARITIGAQAYLVRDPQALGAELHWQLELTA